MAACAIFYGFDRVDVGMLPPLAEVLETGVTVTKLEMAMWINEKMANLWGFSTK